MVHRPSNLHESVATSVSPEIGNGIRGGHRLTILGIASVGQLQTFRPFSNTKKTILRLFLAIQ
jgi:hypothetical protein